MCSTRDLSPLPNIESLRLRLQQMAALDSVFAIESGEPQFEYHPRWHRSEQMCAIKNGSGDEVFVHFTIEGCIILGFAHESAMSPYRQTPPKLWPGLLANIPADFKPSLDEPAFDLASTTFVIWRLATDCKWHTGEIVYSDDSYGDGSKDLLSPLLKSSSEFAEWLSDNYEVEVDATIVESVFDNSPLTNKQLANLRPEVSLDLLRHAVHKVGYSVD